ncbi:MBL fold metallo-hydrolase [Streptomyces sp. NRRL F-5126]|uniref:MBL fold metallo-hydrolase n=1 Tax=Streptomyces sp. NRRL F-5126 TaxID=1463857 RepID=UPI0004CC5D91|nr:MBL fold metallo-hydrolase [Streptomyces sp. NRRL F-5126]
MTLIQLGSRVWQLPLPVSHVHLVRLGGGGFAVVDTGVAGSAPAILDAVAALGGGPGDLRLIVLTHSHLDHAGSAAGLVSATGARVLAGAADAPYISGERPEPPPVHTEKERALHERIMAGLGSTGAPPNPPVRVDTELRDGDSPDDWGETVQVLHVPGHTPGSIALYLPDTGVLFPGDTIATVEGRAVLGPFNLDRAAAVASFRRLAALEPRTVCVPHGEPLTVDAAKALTAATPQDDWL